MAARCNAGLLGFEVSAKQPLMEAGLDSIGAVELRNVVSARFGVDLPATATFDYPTAQSLARYLSAQVAPSPAQFATGAVTQSLQTGPDMLAIADGIAQVLSISRHCSTKTLDVYSERI